MVGGSASRVGWGALPRLSTVGGITPLPSASLALGRRDLSGKTGTSNDRRDAWFGGFNADLASVVWVGFDDDLPLGPGEEGSRTALPIWITYSRIVLDGVPENQLPMPDGIVSVLIDRETGCPSRAGRGNVSFEVFREGHVPECEVVEELPDIFNEPLMFAALHVKGVPNGARILEGPVPPWKVFFPWGKQHRGAGSGSRGKNYGLPHCAHAEFQARFPFGTVRLDDPHLPLAVEVTGWSPFTPGDADSSSLPVAALEYRFKNESDRSRGAGRR